MPRRPREHKIEDQSRTRLREAFEGVGWTVEDLAKDYGEDLLVRIFEDELATPYTFFVQAKSTDNINRYLLKDGRHISYPIEIDHIEHWEQFWEPVVLTVWDSDENVTYWETIQTFVEKHVVPKRKKGKVKKAKSKKAKKSKATFILRVHIPIENKLDDEGIIRILARTKARFRRFEREKYGAEVIIEILKERWGIEIDYDPQFGMLWLPNGEFTRATDGAYTVTAFGKFAALLQEAQSTSGLEPGEIISRGIEMMTQLSDGFDKGEKLKVYNEDGTVKHTFDSFKDYMQHGLRDAELDELDD